MSQVIKEIKGQKYIYDVTWNPDKKKRGKLRDIIPYSKKIPLKPQNIM